MSDLISRSALLETYKNWLPQLTKPEDAGDKNGVETCIAVLELAPAVDAVEVVRCEDCKYNEQVTAPKGYVYCSRWDIGTVDNGFCHMGAKMRGDNDAAD